CACCTTIKINQISLSCLMQGRKPFEEKLFTNFQLSDRVPVDNIYRRLKESLDLRFLYKLTARYYGTEGQESIDPVVFFKLMLVGYLENLGSDRRIISTASLRLDILYFIGYNIDEPLPWHSTLSRTRQLYGEEVFKELFKHVLKLCIEKGMVSGRRQAIDSALIKANASMDSIAEKEIMDDAEAFADELQIKGEDKPQKVTAYKKKKVEEHHRWKAKAYDGMPATRSAKFKEEHAGDEKRPKFLSNHTHYSTTDSDARIAVKPGKPRQLNYLAQTCVDTAHHVITHMEAYHADKKDSQCLPQILKGLKENLQSEGIIVEQVLADTGYSSGAALKALEQQHITGYIPNFGQYKSEREGFTYHKEGDYYTCPENKKVEFKKIKDNNGYAMKEYRTSRKDCANCPLRSTCIGKSFEKSIRDTLDKPYYDQMHERMKSSYARKVKKLRQSTVEPVLGTLINFLAMKRVNTRGIKLANKCMLMAAIAYNLKKAMNFKKTRPMTAVLGLSREAIQRLSSLFFRFPFSVHT
ncbi:IS1182 family transposase, partial [Nitrosomonas communis]|uniref:IS1182 family transposase n=1 Tax=Nitrosomonas communis TaxID=44574 RepID=UPI0026EA388D